MSDDLNIDWQAAAQAENATIIATGTDREYTVTFYMGKVPNFEGTDYTEVPHMRLQAPGQTKCVYDQPVRLDSHPNRPSDPERFPYQWAAFKRGENMDGRGTPLEDFDGITAGDIRRLDMLGIHTVEQLASVSDAHLDGLGFGGRAARERARMFVTGRANHDPEKAALKDQVTKLTDIVTALMERLGEPIALNTETAPEAPETPAPRSRGRAQQEG